MSQPRKGTTVPVNPTRYDPYKNFKFRLMFDGRIVAAANSVSGLPSSSSHESFIKVPTIHKSGDITLKRGVVHDAGFEKWLNGSSSLGDGNPDLVLEMHDEAGHCVSSWTLHECLLSKVESQPLLNDEANALTIHRLVIKANPVRLIR